MHFKTSNQKKSNPIQYLSSLGKDNSKLVTRIALSSINKEHSKFCDMIFLFIEYLQLISQSVLLTASFHKENNNDEGLGLRSAVFISKMMNPGSWLDFYSQKALSRLIFISFAVVIIFKHLIFLYIMKTSKLNKKGYSFIVKLWRLIFKLQGRVICYFITSLYVNVLLTISEGNFDNFGFNKAGISVISVLIIGLEYILSFSIQATFSYVLPCKSFLACKTNRIEILNLLHKSAIQIFQMILVADLLATRWIFVSLNLLFSVIREGDFFTSLPLYNLKALSYQGALSMTVTSLHLSCFLEIIIQTTGYETNMNFILAVWIFLGIMMGKVSNGYLNNKVIINLINNNRGTPEYLVHRISIIKNLRKKQKASPKSEKYPLSQLLKTTVNACMETIFLINPGTSLPQDTKFEKESKVSVNKIFLQYLESLIVKFPKSNFLKLYAAYICAHKLQYFGSAIKLIDNAKQSGSERFKLNASILIYEIQRSLAKESKSESINVNLSEYFDSTTKVAQLKVKMLEQAEAQSAILREIFNDTPNLDYIFQKGQKVDASISNIQKEIKHVLEVISDGCIEPLLVCAHYSLALNDSLNDYLTFYNKYSLKYKKYERFFENDKLSNENLFQENNIFVLSSGQKADAGKIIYCSKTIEDLCGNGPSFFVGKNASSVIAPCHQNFYAAFLKALAEKGDRGLVRNLTRDFAYHAKGYLTQIDFYMDFHPIVSQGLFYNIILRPVPTNKDFILLRENGEIECATEKVGKRLGILFSQSPSSAVDAFNIKIVSEDLSMINHAFNMIAWPNKYKEKGNEIFNEEEKIKNTTQSYEFEMQKDKAEEIYSIYTTKGSTHKLKPVNQSSGPHTYLYSCTMINRFYGQTLIKILTLDQNVQEEADDLKSEMVNRKKVLNVIGYKPVNQITENDLEDFLGSNFADEKHSGWINFKAIENIGPTRKINPSNDNISIAYHVESSPKTEHQLLSPKEKQSPGYCKLSTIQTTKTRKSGNLKPVDPKSSKNKAKKEPKIEKSTRIEGSVTASQWSRTSTRKKISNAIRTALTVKYYPKYIKVFSVLLYGLLFVIFIFQIILKGTLDDALEFVKTGKAIVSNAEMRNYLLVSIQQVFRLVWDIDNGKLNSQNMELLPTTSHFYFHFLASYFENLQNTNENLYLNMNSLDEDTREVLFMKDVRIFDTYFDEPNQTFSMFDNFQATSKIIQTGWKGLGGMERNITQSQDHIYFLFRNTINDLLIKNEMTSEVIMKSLNTQQNDITGTANIYLVISMVLLVILSIALIWAAWRQFQTEKLNMIALLKSKTEQITNTLNRINEFKRKLQSEKSFSDDYNTDILDDALKPPHSKIAKINPMKENVKTANYVGLRNKYIVYVICFLILIGAIAGLVVWHSISNKNSLEFFQQNQAYFFFINRLKSRISLATAVSQELFAGNGTTQIRNNLHSEEFPKVLQNLKTMKNDIFQMFIGEDDPIKAQIRDLLSNDGCLSVDGHNQGFCQSLKTLGKKTSLISVLSDLETTLSELLYNFKTSDKSSQSLITLEAKSFGSPMQYTFVLVPICNSISVLIGQILENDIATKLKERYFNFLAFTFIFVTLNLLIWITAVKPLREANNKFKRVLRAFPAEIILSSFLLKSFLIKSSQDALRFIKGDI